MRAIQQRRTAPKYPLLIAWLVLAVLGIATLDTRAAAMRDPVATISPALQSFNQVNVTSASGLRVGADAATPRKLWQFDALKAHAVGPLARPGVHPIQVDGASIDSWQPGETGEFALPDGRVFQITGHRTETHASGNRSWVGKYEAGGRTYVAVLTYGPAGVAGEIPAPDGPLLLSTEANQVLLTDTAQAGLQIPQHSEPDIKIPPFDTSAAVATDPGVDLKAAPSPQTTIDVLIAYTQSLVTRFGSVAGAQLRLDQLIATSNQAYMDSEVAITLRLVYSTQVSYTDANDNDIALDDLTGGVGAFSAVQGTLRTRYGADVVVLVRAFNYPAHVGCGIAWVGGYGGNGANIGSQSNIGFAVVSDGTDVNNSGYFCQNATFPHELAHTMGAMHDRATVTQGGSSALQTGAYSYSYGYVHNATYSASSGGNVCTAGAGTSCFGTIMSYLSRVSELKFSNPNLFTCPTGLVCGTANDNVALTLNNTRAGVATWRPTKVPFVGAMTGSGQTAATGAGFAQPLKVTIRDAANALVPGVTVNFAVPSSGASATLSATSAVTDANGVAEVTAVANGVPGSYTIAATATSGLVAAPFSFSLANGAATSSLAVSVIGSGTVTGANLNCSSICTSSQANGTSVTLSASPGAGMVFSGWLGGPSCNGTASCSITVNGATNVSATFAPIGTMPAKFDVDLNASYDALTDGVLVVRYLFGITGSSLTSSAVGAGAQRSGPAIQTYLANIAPQLDVDGDGRADALTDGMLIMRYMFGLRGNALIAGAVSPGATRTTAAQIEAYIAARLP